MSIKLLEIHQNNKIKLTIKLNKNNLMSFPIGYFEI